MRASDPPVQYLVGTPKGRLNRLEKHLIDKPWRKAREGVAAIRALGGWASKGLFSGPEPDWRSLNERLLRDIGESPAGAEAPEARSGIRQRPRIDQDRLIPNPRRRGIA